MGTKNQVAQLIRALAAEQRVLVIGGLAVIAHGMSRATKDADIWLDPMESPECWGSALLQVTSRFQGVSVLGLPGWHRVSPAELPAEIDETGMVRLGGLDCPLDVFRRPNQFGEEEFEEVWQRAHPSEDGTRLPDPLDLLVSKAETERSRDLEDTFFLEALVRRQFGERLRTATPEEVRALFARYADHAVCEQALQNPHPEVRELALELLREFAEAGDPFARDLLRDRDS